MNELQNARIAVLKNKRDKFIWELNRIVAEIEEVLGSEASKTDEQIAHEAAHKVLNSSIWHKTDAQIILEAIQEAKRNGN